ncbi:MAG: hypothetical protein ACRD27_07815 [Terracidiphilus sp.]
MAVYRYGSETSPRTLQVRRWLMVAFVLAAAALAASFWTPGRPGSLLGQFAVCAVAVSGVFLWALQTSIRTMRRGGWTYEIEATSAVTRRFNGREVSLTRDEITGYSLNRAGTALTLHTTQRARQLGVSSNLEDFTGLLKELQRMGIREAPSQTWGNDWRFCGRLLAPLALMILGVAVAQVSVNPTRVAAGDLVFLAALAAALLWPTCANGVCRLQSGMWRWGILGLTVTVVLVDLHDRAGWPLPHLARAVLEAGGAGFLGFLLWESWRQRQRRARAQRAPARTP